MSKTKVPFSGKVSYKQTISSSDALNLINDLHNYGWQGQSFDDPEWVAEVDTYHLVWMPVGATEIKWCKGQHGHLNYHLMGNDMPPIVIGDNGFIIDGMHRYAATLEAGREYILAYVSERFVHLGVTPRFL